MKGDELDPDQHVVRYIQATFMRAGSRIVEGEAFEPRQGEQEISVNWLEFCGSERGGQLAEIRSACRMGRRSTLARRRRDRFAELNVGVMMSALSEDLDSARVIHDPEDATEEYGPNLSHTLITGLPPHGSDKARTIGDLIAECVTVLHPVVKPQH